MVHVPKRLLEEPLSQLDMMFLAADVVDSFRGKWKLKEVDKLYRFLKKRLRNIRGLKSVRLPEYVEVFGIKKNVKPRVALAILGVIQAKRREKTELARLCEFGFGGTGNWTWDVRNA